MPAMPELHACIGRTGRADKTGTAISFTREKEVEIEVLMNMELVLSRSRPKWKFLPS
jgi:ATP-dependent RNA helicase RhlE